MKTIIFGFISCAAGIFLALFLSRQGIPPAINIIVSTVVASILFLFLDWFYSFR